MWTLAKALLVAFVAGQAAAAAAQPAEGEMALGDPGAPVTVIEFASMTCPHCGAFHTDTFPRLKAEYIDTGLVRFVFREFPLDRVAFSAAVLARCAGPDRFFPFIDTLFRQQEDWSRADDPMESLYQLAQIGGLPRAEFDACLNDEALATAVLTSRLDGESEYGVRSTPSFVVNGVLVEGNLPWQEFAAILDDAAAGEDIGVEAEGDRESSLGGGPAGMYIAIALVIGLLAAAMAFLLRRRPGGGA